MPNRGQHGAWGRRAYWQRVASAAQPGEVLVSSTVKDLVVGSGIAFEDRGTHTLKGVPGEWHLFAVVPSNEVIE